MQLTWLDPADLDPRELAGAVAVLESARLADFPHELPLTVASYTADLQHGWDGDPPVAAVTHDGQGRVVGVLEVHLPRRDNRHLAYVDPFVDPLVRRQGIGRALFEAGVEVLVREGRTLVLAECFDSAATDDFAKSLGLDRAIDSVKRRQDVRTVDQEMLARLYDDAEAASVDYELVRLPARTPDELVPDVVTMIGAINDAPTDDLDVEDEVFSAERLRAFQVAQEAHARRVYQLAARHRPTGVLAGHTMVAVESERPSYGNQLDTSVLGEHRGHRLGLLLKIAMMRWLAEAEPQLRTLSTWNAASNEHMIAVNEAIGYQVVATATGYQRHL